MLRKHKTVGFAAVEVWTVGICRHWQRRRAALAAPRGGYPLAREGRAVDPGRKSRLAKVTGWNLSPIMRRVIHIRPELSTKSSWLSTNLMLNPDLRIGQGLSTTPASKSYVVYFQAGSSTLEFSSEYPPSRCARLLHSRRSARMALPEWNSAGDAGVQLRHGATALANPAPRL